MANASSDGDERLDTWGFSLRGLWETGSGTVTSLTGYEWYDRKIDDEGDAIPITAFPAVYEDSAWQASQELRAEGEGERYRWAAGGFLSTAEDLARFGLQMGCDALPALLHGKARFPPQRMHRGGIAILVFQVRQHP